MVKTRPFHLLHRQSALHPTWIHSVGAMHVKKPFYGVRWARRDKSQGQSTRWRSMESSRNLSCDTCISEFDQGWVRDHQSPSGIKNYQREDTNQISKADSPPCKHLYMDLHPRDPEVRGWNFVSCKEVLLVSWCNIIVLGGLSFSWGEEGLLAERMMLG